MDYTVTTPKYYNRIDEPEYKGTKQLLFQAGVILQNAEVNEVQSLIHQEVTNLTSEFIANGQVIKDASIEILYDGVAYSPSTSYDENTLFDISLHCNSGVLYVGEYFNDIESIDIDIGNITLAQFASVEYTLGAIITLTEDDVNSIDPAVEFDNYKQPGAPFLKVDVSWALEPSEASLGNNQEFVPIYFVEDGELLRVVDVSPLDKKIINVSAKYDRNSNGNYIVNGYGVTFQEYLPGTDLNDKSGPFVMDIGSGSVNVYGYNHEARKSQKLNLPQMTDTWTTDVPEPITTYTGPGWYDMSHTPLYKVLSVTGPVEELDESYPGSFTASAGSPHDVPLNNIPLFSVTNVYKVTGDVLLTEGVGNDYVKNGDNIQFFIDIDSNGFRTSYLYNHTVNDFDSPDEIYGNETGEISDDKTQVYLTGFKSGEDLFVEYIQMYTRIDTIVVNSEGDLEYIKGFAEEYNPRPVSNVDETRQMILAQVTLEYGVPPVIELSGNKVFDMKSIQLILNGLNQNIYNTNKLALVTDLMLNNPTANLRNTFVDDFDNNAKRWGLDTGTAMTMFGNLIMDITWENIVVDTSSLITSDEISYLSLDSSKISTPVLEQEYYTKTRQINEYMFKTPPMAYIDVHPRVYKWITSTSYTQYVRTIQQAKVTTSTGSWDSGLIVANQKQDQFLSAINVWTDRWNWNGWKDNTLPNRFNDVIHGNVTREIVGTTVTTSSSIKESDTPEIIPQIQLRVRSNVGAFSSSEPVNVFFDEHLVSGSPFNADLGGTLNTLITIPDGKISGHKGIRIESDSGVTGETIFEAVPLHENIHSTITARWRWHELLNHDPVAQSFRLDETSIIDGIKVYFEVSPTTPTSVILAETTAGYPDRDKFINAKTIDHNDLIIGDNGTYFEFESKVAVEKDKEYAFIVMCDDAVGSVRCARLGEKGKIYSTGPSKWLTSQAYNIGVMYNSSNNSTWTPIQEEDIKFEIYGSSFGLVKTFTFPTIGVVNACDIMLFANAELDIGTDVEFTAKLSDGTTYVIVPYSQMSLERDSGAKYTGTVEISAKLTSIDGTRTPKLDPSIQLGVGTVLNNTDAPGGSSYTSQYFKFNPNGTKIQVYLDQYKPSFTSITVQYDSNGDGITWIDIPFISEIDLENSWSEALYEYTLADGPTSPPVEPIASPATRIRIILNTSDIRSRPVIANLRSSVHEI